jgi:hypothetical protein
MEDPEQLAKGLRGEQAEAEAEYSALRERLSVIEALLGDNEQQLSRLLDLYLSGDFPRDMLTERKARLEKTVADLSREREELTAHVRAVTITDGRIAEVEAFRAEIREGLEAATFADKWRYFELLDVRGKMAVEDNERVICASCKLGKRRLSHMPISLWSSNHNVTPVVITARLVIEKMRE